MMDKEEENQEPDYPLDAKFYTLIEEIGQGMSSIIYRAFCDQTETEVVIKSINLDKSISNFDSILSMPNLLHPNISNSHCTFVTPDNEIWVVMPPMSAGSLQSIISSFFPAGLFERHSKIILKQTLNLLSYLHSKNVTQMELKAGNILVDLKGSVKFSDFNLWSSSLKMKNTTGNSYWISPELVKSQRGFSEKSDIWSFGILALELVHGGPPLYDIPLSKSTRKKINERFCFGNYYEDHYSGKFKTPLTKSFMSLVRKCLQLDPEKRPTLKELRNHLFFEGCESSVFLGDNILQHLPDLADRFEHSKQRMVQGEDDGYDEDENNIGGWHLNVDVLKLFPFYSSSSELNEIRKDRRVKFGGEIIIEDIIPMEEDEKEENQNQNQNQNQDQDQDQNQNKEEEEDYYVNRQLGAVCVNLNEVIGKLNEAREVFLETLFTAKDNLEEQVERLRHLILLHGGSGKE